MLAAGVSLTALDLWDSSVSDAGVTAIARALPQSQLRLLGLWGE